MEPVRVPRADVPSSVRAVVGAAVVIVALLLLVAGSFYYPYPDGKSPTFSEFFVFWARELILLGIALAAMILARRAWARRGKRANRL
jgi:hypothetical protein